MGRSRVAIALWLVFLLVCGLIISRSQFTTDLSAFLPSSPTPEQKLLLDQITDGLASRLILVGIEGADAPTRARLAQNAPALIPPARALYPNPTVQSLTALALSRSKQASGSAITSCSSKSARADLAWSGWPNRKNPCGGVWR